jgi:hypothetical protein
MLKWETQGPRSSSFCSIWRVNRTCQNMVVYKTPKIPNSIPLKYNVYSNRHYIPITFSEKFPKLRTKESPSLGMLSTMKYIQRSQIITWNLKRCHNEYKTVEMRDIIYSHP